MTSSKASLKASLEELQRKKSEVPSRALAFHQRAAGLISKMEEELGKFFRAGNRLKELDDQAAELISISPALLALLNDVLAVENRCEILTRGLKPYPQLLAQMEEKKAKWLDRLRPLARIDSDLSFQAERKETASDTLDRVELVSVELKPVEQFVSQFIALQNDLKQLRSRGQDVKGLEDFLAQAVDLFAKRDPPAPEFLEKMGFRHQTALEILNTPKPKAPEAPPALRTIRLDNGQIQEWASVLGEYSDVKLGDRLKLIDAPASWGKAREIDQLSQDVAARLNDLRKIAQDRRDELRGRLGEDLRYYEIAVPDDHSESSARLAELDRMSTREAHEYLEWVEEMTKVRADFDSRATTKADALYNYLCQRVGDLSHEVDKAVATDDLTDELHDEVQSLKARLNDRLRSKSRNDILASLRLTTEDEDAVKKIRTQAVADKQLFAAIRARHADLERAAKSMEIAFDLPLPGGVARRKVDELSASVSHAVERFMEIATAQIQRARERQSRIGMALHEADPLTAPELPQASQASSPQNPSEAAAVWLEISKWLSDAEARVDSALENLVKESAVHALKLQGVTGLSEEDVLGARDLLAQIETREWNLCEAPIEKLASIAGTVLDCRAFFDRQTEVQRDTEQKRQRLLKRTQALREEGFRAYFQYHGTRLVWLLQGAAKQTQDFQMANYQLDAADALLTRMEQHGPRLAAQELRRMCEAAELRIASAAASKSGLDRDLQEVRKHQQEGRLAPADLRKRLRDSLQKRADA